MKKASVIAVFLMLFLTIVTARPTYADFSGISGAALNADGDTLWTDGGDVSVWIEDVTNGYIECTGTIDNTGHYSITFDTTSCGSSYTGDIQNFSTIFIEADFNPHATTSNDPPNYSGTAGNRNLNTGTLTHNLNTQSGPTAVSLQSISAAGSQSGTALLSILAMLILATFFVVRRRAAR